MSKPLTIPGNPGWIELPDGIECIWGADRGVNRRLVQMTLFFLVMDALVIYQLRIDQMRIVPIHTFFALIVTAFTFLFGGSAITSFRASGFPSRLRATSRDGLAYWPSTNHRPKFSLPRKTILDVKVDEAGLYRRLCGHRWSLVVICQSGWRKRRIIFSSFDRNELDSTCGALRNGLRIT